MQRHDDAATEHSELTVQEPMMEEYRIQPVTSDERTCDGVYVDSIGAWLGKVVTDETTGQPVTIVEPLLNTIGGRIPAPPNWRNLVIERLPA